MSEHSEISPSGLHRVLNCPGSVRQCRGLESKSSMYSMDGSIVHDLNKLCLLRGQDAEDYLGYWGWYNKNNATGVQELKPTDKGLLRVIQITEKEVQSSQIYLDVIRASRAKHPSAEYKVEEKMDMGWISPGMKGTGDHIIREFFGILIVDDYKNGFNEVEIEMNPQFLTYALGALGPNNDQAIEDVMIRVIQPNGMHHKGLVRSQVLSVKRVYKWKDEVLLPGIARAQDPNAPLIPGSWCFFCEASRQHKCPKQTELAVDTMFGTPIDLTKDFLPEPPDPKTLSRVRMDKVLKVADMMESWLKAAKEEAYRRLEVGDPDAPVNFKLVDGPLSDRKWADEQKVVEAFKPLGVEVYQSPKIKSPAQLEKDLVKKYKPKEREEKIKPLLAERKRGKPVMVPITDERPSIVDKMFG